MLYEVPSLLENWLSLVHWFIDFFGTSCGGVITHCRCLYILDFSNRPLQFWHPLKHWLFRPSLARWILLIIFCRRWTFTSRQLHHVLLLCVVLKQVLLYVFLDDVLRWDIVLEKLILVPTHFSSELVFDHSMVAASLLLQLFDPV